ncbi:MAG: hypothetical protein H6626_12940 [Pseudobdellovibrionaceae bacterium]|nr:hypothetical protein [Bdellovibrionales bacterium]USN47080.1 MAG: hypothetical protein H6626_12940 [Pseudobdellovibrionaceae bacterium]
MKDNKGMMKGMILGGITAFVFVFLFEFLVHGFLLKGPYEATMSVWRPQEQSNMAVMLLSQFLFAMSVAFFYPIVGPDKAGKKAVPFGIGLGLVMAMPQIATYSYLPIPISISLYWAIASFGKAFGCSFIVSKIFNKFANKM